MFCSDEEKKGLVTIEMSEQEIGKLLQLLILTSALITDLSHEHRMVAAVSDRLGSQVR